MTTTKPGAPTEENRSFFHFLRQLINLRTDTDKVGTVEFIKANVEFRSANAWTLVFAIFIASVGLNVNSTAVVIGAMLISPLMGPIVGAGFALGTNDFPLLKTSTKNLGVAVLISLVASTLYFLVSPLSDVQSELLARTRPSFFDVLIAFFGGAAGIVAISRKEKGNAIPGVAIATALMPPLCTAGFGLATRNWSYFLGAMYLFVINGVFISISTFLIVRYLDFHEVVSLGADQQKSINRWIAYVGGAVLIPSLFMAWYLQRESSFRSHADKFIDQELRSDRFIVVDRDISYSLKDPRIRISLLGEPLANSDLGAIIEKAQNYSLEPKSVEIRQSTFSENLEKRIGEKISAAEGEAARLKMQLGKSERELSEYTAMDDLSKNLREEIDAFVPGKISNVYVLKQGQPTLTTNADESDRPSKKSYDIVVRWKALPPVSELRKSNSFLARRLAGSQIQIANVKEL